MRLSDAGPGWDRFEGGRNRSRDRTPASVRRRRDSGAYGLVGPKEPGAVAVDRAVGRGGGVPVPVRVHPQAIDLSQLDAPTTVGSGRLPVSATLLVCLPAIIPTLWMGGMVLLALAVRY